MYSPSHGVMNAVMRWPVLGGLAAGGAALSLDGLPAAAASFVAGSVLGAFGLTKAFNEQICKCEEKGYTKLAGPKIEWIIEYNVDSGAKRPWEVYSMFAGLESTKQHYASYATEEHALDKIKALKDMVSKDQTK